MIDGELLKKVKDFLGFELVKLESVQINIYEILIGILIIFITALLLKLLRRIFKKVSQKGVMDQGTSNSLFQIIKYFIWVVVFVLILDTIGVKVSIFIASAAALLVGVGLGLQQLFNDIASGIILLIERSLKVNDVVEMENEMVGRVITIGLRTSKIKTRDNITVIVPNSQLVNDRVINWSHAEIHTRFHVDVGVAYGSDIELVTKVLKSCAQAHPNILATPEPFVRFINFGDSSLDFQLFFWTDEAFSVENTKSDLRYKIDKAFREHAIQIPFPQRDVYLKSTT
jgi:small-conductance mechanosensitive channel